MVRNHQDTGLPWPVSWWNSVYGFMSMMSVCKLLITTTHTHACLCRLLMVLSPPFTFGVMRARALSSTSWAVVSFSVCGGWGRLLGRMLGTSSTLNLGCQRVSLSSGTSRAGFIEARNSCRINPRYINIHARFHKALKLYLHYKSILISSVYIVLHYPALVTGYLPLGLHIAKPHSKCECSLLYIQFYNIWRRAVKTVLTLWCLFTISTRFWWNMRLLSSRRVADRTGRAPFVSAVNQKLLSKRFIIYTTEALQLNPIFWGSHLLQRAAPRWVGRWISSL